MAMDEKANRGLMSSGFQALIMDFHLIITVVERMVTGSLLRHVRNFITNTEIIAKNRRSLGYDNERVSFIATIFVVHWHLEP
jgi:hypothetical protein